LRARLRAGGRGERDAVDLVRGGGHAIQAGAQLRLRCATLRDQHRGELGALDAAEALELGVDGGRLRAGHAEAAAGEVLGLAGRERQGGEEDHGPGGQDDLLATAQEAVEAQHRGLHGGEIRSLAGWPANRTERDCGDV
jgi:hypothetical protein